MAMPGVDRLCANMAPDSRLCAGKRDQEHANMLLERVQAVSCGYTILYQ